MPCVGLAASHVPLFRPRRPSAVPGAGPRGRSQALCAWRRESLLAASLGIPVAVHLARPLPAGAVIVDEDEAERVFSAVQRSVVAITEFRSDGKGGEDVEGVGSGIVWDTAGHVVTNYHCIERLATDRTGQQGTRVGILTPSGDTLELIASIVGTDPSNDLAVLKVDADPSILKPPRFATSGAIRVGQTVYALGNPSGLRHTLSAGVVSGLGRSIPSPTGQLIPGAIQTDARIDAGNSGGALIDSGGRVVGINTATFTRKGTGGGSGVNFALPTDLVVEIVPKLIAYGRPAGARGV